MMHIYQVNDYDFYLASSPQEALACAEKDGRTVAPYPTPYTVDKVRRLGSREMKGFHLDSEDTPRGRITCYTAYRKALRHGDQPGLFASCSM